MYIDKYEYIYLYIYICLHIPFHPNCNDNLCLHTAHLHLCFEYIHTSMCAQNQQPTSIPRARAQTQPKPPTPIHDLFGGARHEGGTQPKCMPHIQGGVCVAYKVVYVWHTLQPKCMPHIHTLTVCAPSLPPLLPPPDSFEGFRWWPVVLGGERGGERGGGRSCFLPARCLGSRCARPCWSNVSLGADVCCGRLQRNCDGGGVEAVEHRQHLWPQHCQTRVSASRAGDGLAGGATSSPSSHRRRSNIVDQLARARNIIAQPQPTRANATRSIIVRTGPRARAP